MEGVLNSLAGFVDGLHPIVQVLGVLVIGFVPFLESYTGAFIGAVTGMSLAVALVGSIVGNLVAVWIAVRLGAATAAGVENRRGPRSDRQKKIIGRVDRWGVPVASLLAPTVMAISITAYVMVAAGLDRRQVAIWQAAAVVAWGVLFALLGLGLLSALT